jgi:hypothetical protein
LLLIFTNIALTARAGIAVRSGTGKVCMDEDELTSNVIEEIKYGSELNCGDLNNAASEVVI